MYELEMDEQEKAREEVAALLELTKAGKTARQLKKEGLMQKQPKSKAKRIAGIIGNGLFGVVMLCLIVVLASGIQAKQRGEIPTVFGYSLFQVETGSMVPTLPIGSYIITRVPVDAQTLKEGQIVTFRFTNGTVVTHRIIEVARDDLGAVAYRTKGDNPLNDPDFELLTPDRVLREFVYVITLPDIWGK